MRNAPMTYMSAVVMQELRAGAVTDAQAKVLQDGIFDVFERRNRVVCPSALAFKDCGRILATLFRQDGVPLKDRPRSLVNDILIEMRPYVLEGEMERAMAIEPTRAVLPGLGR
jgi:hypothetical protein